MDTNRAAPRRTKSGRAAPDPVDRGAGEVALSTGGALVVAGLLALVAVAAVVDVILDDPERWLSAHVLVELGVATLSLGLALYLVRGWSRASRTLARTREALEERRVERDRWRRNARTLLEGLGEAIDEQFREWELTPAEREVALLLIKGHSHKKVARLTGRSERTARQHAGAVYRKAGVSGRAELAAFFLEDLILPDAGEEEGEAGTPAPE